MRVASNYIAHICHTCSPITGPVSCIGYERLPNLVTDSKRRLQSPRSGRTRYTASATGGTNSSSNADDAAAIKARLRAAIAKSERGVVTDEAITREILAAIESLEELGGGGRADERKESPVTTSDESLSATWKLLWTTEKETLFIFKQAPLFSTTAGDTFQTIDVAKGTLSNTITFPPSGMFDVSASIQVASAQRVTFHQYPPPPPTHTPTNPPSHFPPLPLSLPYTHMFNMSASIHVASARITFHQYPPSPSISIPHASIIPLNHPFRSHLPLRSTPSLPPLLLPLLLLSHTCDMFTGARLVTASWTLPVPPFGQGWFDNTYIDKEIRISRDSRGDVLVAERSAQD
ncbi:unnamed protein product [Closterium sp. NIES-65]|nr:unnamed protein product [Closterium sp. NIES-65]